jgi:chromosome segregation ATPase
MLYGLQGELSMRNSISKTSDEEHVDEADRTPHLNEIGRLKAEIASLTEEKEQLLREIECYRSGMQLLAVSVRKYKFLLKEAGKSLRIIQVQNNSLQIPPWKRWLTGR